MSAKREIIVSSINLLVIKKQIMSSFQMCFQVYEDTRGSLGKEKDKLRKSISLINEKLLLTHDVTVETSCYVFAYLTINAQKTKRRALFIFSACIHSVQIENENEVINV